MEQNISQLVSIVVTTKNEERHIGNCLASIQLQTYSAIETIIVDNFSTDKTQEIASNFTNKIFSKGPERSAQRNYGMINQANGDFVMYVDADMILSPNLVETCVLQMSSTNAVSLFIPEFVLGLGFLPKVRNFERSFYNGTSIDGSRFFRRDTFIAAGGFDEQLFREGSGEDWDIDKAVRQFGQIELLAHHNTPVDFNRWNLISQVEVLNLQICLIFAEYFTTNVTSIF